MVKSPSLLLLLQSGSVQVRIRRDANEQMVLAHVYHRLSNLVAVLAVQIFKDDWTRPSTFQVMTDCEIKQCNKQMKSYSTCLFCVTNLL